MKKKVNYLFYPSATLLLALKMKYEDVINQGFLTWVTNKRETFDLKVDTYGLTDLLLGDSREMYCNYNNSV